MATRDQCEAAVRSLATRIDGVEAATRRRYVPDRTVVCRVPDLATSFSGEFRGGELVGLSEGARDHDAQIVFTLDSDDLVALADGSLPAGTAWATGRLKVDASLFDLLRLRTLV
jgi:hypothetical protein